MQVSLHSARAVQKASICTSLTRELGMLPERPSRYSPAAAVHALRQCWGRTRPVLQRSFAFPHTNGSTNFFATYQRSDVGPLSCQVTLKPVSAPLQRGIRFFQYPTPAPPLAEPCGLLSPEGERYGVSTFHAKKSYRLRCLLSTGMHVGHDAHNSQMCIPHPVPFGSSAMNQATYACSRLRSLSQIQMFSPYRLASTYPACGCQEGLSLALDTPHLSAPRYVVRDALDSAP
jgi:hypothetical protein